MTLVSGHSRAALIRMPLSWAIDINLTIMVRLPGPSKANELRGCLKWGCIGIEREQSGNSVQSGPTHFIPIFVIKKKT